jgi:hypothetical protein
MPSDERPPLQNIMGFAALLTILVGALVVWSCLPTREQPVENARGNSLADAAVVIEIDKGDGEPIAEFVVDHRDNLTVIDAMHQVAEIDSLQFQSSGSGRGAFVSSIAGVANGDSDGRYWLFDVNGEQSTVGAGSRVLEPGDRVLWRLDYYE